MTTIETPAEQPSGTLSPGSRLLTLASRYGTFVAFLSADFEHEVLPARRERLALAGWFRRRVLT